jgi:hypothetical protein
MTAEQTASSHGAPLCATADCWLNGHEVVSHQWSATDGDCDVCAKPLSSQGTGRRQCKVQCCNDCMLPNACILSSHKHGCCCSCQRPVIHGAYYNVGCRLVCTTCRHLWAAPTQQAPAITIAAPNTCSQPPSAAPGALQDALQVALQAAEAAVSGRGLDLVSDARLTQPSPISEQPLPESPLVCPWSSTTGPLPPQVVPPYPKCNSQCWLGRHFELCIALAMSKVFVQ